MATAAARTRTKELEPHWRDALRASVKRFALRTWGALLLAVSVGAALALATHNSTDPSFSTAAGGPPANWMGSIGAYTSDMLFLLFGLGSVLFLPVIGLAGLRMMRLERVGRIGRAVLVAAVGAILIGIALSLTSGSAVSGLPGGWGGAIGLAAAHGVDAGLDLIPNPAIAAPARLAVLVLFALAGLFLGFLAMGLQQSEKAWVSGLFKRDPRPRIAAPRRSTEIAEDRPSIAPAKPPRAVTVAEPARPIAPAATQPRGGKRPPAAQQSLALGDNYQLPSLDLLSTPPEKGGARIDRAGLERNARLLEAVLDDFKVRGEIVEVRPGPVVTMYELEPASGTKASRVIALADDIARNMSALS
ncbi:MAG TPA: DNA translocase FtsK 4TM domain-containing protein, partial [Sphingomicrobium sp.]